jgi:hypothetical protein
MHMQRPVVVPQHRSADCVHNRTAAIKDALLNETHGQHGSAHSARMQQQRTACSTARSRCGT